MASLPGAAKGGANTILPVVAVAFGGLLIVTAIKGTSGAGLNPFLNLKQFIQNVGSTGNITDAWNELWSDTNSAAKDPTNRTDPNAKNPPGISNQWTIYASKNDAENRTSNYQFYWESTPQPSDPESGTWPDPAWLANPNFAYLYDFSKAPNGNKYPVYDGGPQGGGKGIDYSSVKAS